MVESKDEQHPLPVRSKRAGTYETGLSHSFRESQRPCGRPRSRSKGLSALLVLRATFSNRPTFARRDLSTANTSGKVRTLTGSSRSKHGGAADLIRWV